MKRVYVCEIVGDGSEENTFRPAVLDYPCGWVRCVAHSETDGRPPAHWMLAAVGADNHAELLKDARLVALPDFPMDGKMGDMSPDIKNAMLAALAARGIETEFIDSADGYRDVLRGIGRQLSPEFDENTFDVN